VIHHLRRQDEIPYEDDDTCADPQRHTYVNQNTHGLFRKPV
jgi:hypothetical protein